jgi:hypothetical protein
VNQLTDRRGKKRYGPAVTNVRRGISAMASTEQEARNGARMRPTELLDQPGRSHPFREFIVEFFGILLPGFAFTAGLFPSVVFPALALLIALPGGVSLTGDRVATLFEMFKIEVLIAIAAFSYVWGHVFYRLDPKLPDTISYWIMPERHRKDDSAGACHDDQPKSARKRFWHHIREAVFVSSLYQNILDNKESERYPCTVDFPYHGLKKWFENKGMNNLAELVNWSGEDRSKETKHLVNLMKMALEFTFPEQYARIARNEAHVRLVCSVWYASCFLILFSMIGLTVAVVVIVVGYSPWSAYSSFYLAVLLMVLAAVMGLVRLKASVEQSLHYMRVREIVFVFAEFRYAAELAPEIRAVLPPEIRAVLAQKQTISPGDPEPSPTAGLARTSQLTPESVLSAVPRS